MYSNATDRSLNLMKRISLIWVTCWLTAASAVASGINYNGTNLTENKEFSRTQCGTSYKNVMKEVSGLACSRQTPGYLWAVNDENMGDDRKIIAITPGGTLTMTVKLNTPGSDRDDWEDIATGIYNNTNYLFISATGDNDKAYNDAYYIYYLEEPSIASGTIEKTAGYIRFGYPDNQAHNTETLMYDNIEQMLYIVDKEDGVCHMYQLPFRTDYGTGVQRLTEVCALGDGNKFKEATGGDISPSGKWMAVKNEKYILLWERAGNESLSETAQRLPEQIAAYEKEDQGESLAWLNDTTFFTTSDSKKDTPIYRYDRWGGSIVNPEPEPEPVPVDSTQKEIKEIILANNYYAYINEDETVVRGWYLAGKEKPVVDSCQLSPGAVWAQQDDTLTITALDGSVAVYTLDIQPVTPCEFTAEEIVFDGSESSWVKSAYGWDETKKWKFSKTDDDYSREIAGKTHVEFFLPACDTVVLKSIDANERDIRIYVNGVKSGSKTKLLKAGTTVVVEQPEAFMLSVVSSQSSGDGGVKVLRMARKPGETEGVEQASRPQERKARIEIRDGQIVLVVGENRYTLTCSRL